MNYFIEGPIQSEVPIPEIQYEHQLKQDMIEARDTRIPLELVVTTCPPYSVNDKGEFLFNGTMQMDAGIVARKTIDQLMSFLALCQHHSVPVKLTFAYADQEGYDEDVLATLYPEFRVNFQRYVTYAMTHIVQIANTLLYQNSITLVQVDACSMHVRFFSRMDSNLIHNYLEQVNSMQFANILSLRSKIHTRMYRNDNDVRIRRTHTDIKEHIALGLALQSERLRGNKVSIVTMSIPNLSKLFNEFGNCIVPVIKLSQNY